jgi:hypothetical protein
VGGYRYGGVSMPFTKPLGRFASHHGLQARHVLFVPREPLRELAEPHEIITSRVQPLEHDPSFL